MCAVITFELSCIARFILPPQKRLRILLFFSVHVKTLSVVNDRAVSVMCSLPGMHLLGPSESKEEISKLSAFETGGTQFLSFLLLSRKEMQIDR